mmetsp:Transcript_1336/g.2919  ORF Transcript_1336/g.2919 Transcript_1336/m.2919 type:complete len:226 (-) Transcript_1336:206-883(-)
MEKRSVSAVSSYISPWSIIRCTVSLMSYTLASNVNHTVSTGMLPRTEIQSTTFQNSRYWDQMPSNPYRRRTEITSRVSATKFLNKIKHHTAKAATSTACVKVSAPYGFIWKLCTTIIFQMCPERAKKKTLETRAYWPNSGLKIRNRTEIFWLVSSIHGDPSIPEGNGAAAWQVLHKHDRFSVPWHPVSMSTSFCCHSALVFTGRNHSTRCKCSTDSAAQSSGGRL